MTLVVEREASLAHLVKASQEDLEWLYPGREIEDSLAAWTKSGPRFCVVTLGERGAVAMLGKERIEVPAPRVEVVDTVGAGDSFMSALLSAMDRDGALGAETRRRRLEANSKDGSGLRRPPPRSPARAKAQIRPRVRKWKRLLAS